mmetsp:Transcript_11940/g.32289  ORF Transcript_11940/g.32289 Transcript_11940/m.32289 type:complete len:247 (+) Transcript_11940:2560-3300(+)
MRASALFICRPSTSTASEVLLFEAVGIMRRPFSSSRFNKAAASSYAASALPSSTPFSSMSSPLPWFIGTPFPSKYNRANSIAAGAYPADTEDEKHSAASLPFPSSFLTTPFANISHPIFTLSADSSTFSTRTPASFTSHAYPISPLTNAIAFFAMASVQLAAAASSSSCFALSSISLTSSSSFFFLSSLVSSIESRCSIEKGRSNSIGATISIERTPRLIPSIFSDNISYRTYFASARPNAAASST